MGTPSTPTVRDIVREAHQKKAPTFEELVALLDARRETLRPGLRYMALKPINEFPIVEGQLRWTLKERHGSIVSWSHFSSPRDLQGYYYQLQSGENEFILVGLSRSVTWVWVIISRGNIPRGFNQGEMYCM